MKRKQPETSGEFLDSVTEALNSVEPETDAEVDAELRRVGLSRQMVGRQIAQLVDDGWAQSPLNWRVRARKERHAALKKLEDTEPQDESRAVMEAEIENLLAHGRVSAAPEARAYFHKRDGGALSDGDLATLLQHLRFLNHDDGAE